MFFSEKRTHPLEGVTGREVRNVDGKIQNIIYIDGSDGLHSLCQSGVIELHPWGTHVQNYLRPDLMIFDIDPDPGVKPEAVAEAALELKDLLDRLELESFCKVSGGKGYHLHVPIEPVYTWDQVKNFTRSVVTQLSQQNPIYLTVMSKSKRKGKIFLDYLRNGYGATAIAAYALRARAGGPVAMPIPWSQVGKASPSEFDIKTVIKMKPSQRNPWKRYFDVHQRIAVLDQALST